MLRRFLSDNRFSVAAAALQIFNFGINESFDLEISAKKIKVGINIEFIEFSYVTVMEL